MLKSFPKATRNRPHKATFIPVLSLLLGTLLTACDQTSCTCSSDVKFNPCLTWAQGSELPDSLSYFREMRGGKVDGLLAGSNCFADQVGEQRILVRKDDSLLHATDWFEIKPLDCCQGQPRTIELAP